MPRRRSNLSSRTRSALRSRKIAMESTEEELKIAREKNRVRMAQFRAAQSEEQRAAAREAGRLAKRSRRASLRCRRRATLSVNLRDIVSYSSRHEREQPLSSIKLTPKEKYASDPFGQLAPVETYEAGDDDEDCIAIKVSNELIEMSDDQETPVKLTTDEFASCSLPLKIQKIESLNKAQAQSLGHSLIGNATDTELPRSVQSYEEALRLLKQIEEFVLLEENYQAIGLVTQLEKILESSDKEAQNANASK